MRFVWDPVKARSNVKKHKLTFEEAVTVFLDREAIRIHDPEHSVSEDRWILLGLSTHIRVLVVVHLEKDANVIRIISARKANAKELKSYIKGRL
jgi:uncharacterized DUF497 family protein